ncbi:MAG: hypothetical protein ACOC5E_02785 [Acidobacteriota bacterium]
MEVCHLDEDTGEWELLDLPRPAADNHLAHHDDALPGDTTPSGTPLDDSCDPVVLECPCYDTDDVVALFDPGEPERDLTCSADSSSAFIHDLDESWGPWLVESLEQFDDSAGEFWTCEQTLLGDSSDEELHMEISEAEHLACVDVIAAAQVELGCS